jgi:hypothetical protein
MVEEAKVMSVMGLMMADELTTTLTMALMIPQLCLTNKYFHYAT